MEVDFTLDCVAVRLSRASEGGTTDGARAAVAPVRASLASAPHRGSHSMHGVGVHACQCASPTWKHCGALRRRHLHLCRAPTVCPVVLHHSPPSLPAEPQYQSYHLLLSEVSSFSARLAHSAYRPRLRPAGTRVAAHDWAQLTMQTSAGMRVQTGRRNTTPNTHPRSRLLADLLPPLFARARAPSAAGEQARLWWRYAVKAVQQQVLARKLTWSQAVKVRGQGVGRGHSWCSLLKDAAVSGRQARVCSPDACRGGSPTHQCRTLPCSCCSLRACAKSTCRCTRSTCARPSTRRAHATACLRASWTWTGSCRSRRSSCSGEHLGLGEEAKLVVVLGDQRTCGWQSKQPPLAPLPAMPSSCVRFVLQSCVDRKMQQSRRLLGSHPP